MILSRLSLLAGLLSVPSAYWSGQSDGPMRWFQAGEATLPTDLLVPSDCDGSPRSNTLFMPLPEVDSPALRISASLRKVKHGEEQPGPNPPGCALCWCTSKQDCVGIPAPQQQGLWVDSWGFALGQGRGSPNTIGLRPLCGEDLEVRGLVVEPLRWLTEATGTLRYHGLGQLPQGASERLQAEILRLQDLLGAPAPTVLDYYLYPSVDLKSAMTGVPGNGHRVGAEVHSIWEIDSHELAHVLASGWGRPPPLVSEGVAVWASGSWRGVPVVEAASRLGERWVPLEELSCTRCFRQVDSVVSYAEAGAFVAWVMATRGLPAVQALHRLPDQSPADNREALQRLLGASLEQSEAELLRWVGAQAAQGDPK